MPLPLLAIAAGLVKVAPMVAGWFGGSDAEDQAEKAVNIAKQITGIDDAQGAVDAIKADPALAMQFQAAVMAHELAMRKEDNNQLAIVNGTMQAELLSKDKYNRRWRATFGYAVAASWTMMFLTIMIVFGWAIFKHPDGIADTGAALADMLGATTVLWGVALSVLGISVKKRSDDKQMAAGIQPVGVLAGLGKLMGK